MCRWLAYTGNAIPLSRLIYDTEHSLIDQSLSARSSVQTTNGDGFGIGWYSGQETPALYKHTHPAWNDPNLKDLCAHTRSTMFLAHVRAATGTAIQYSNCHPFRYGRWMFVHNGVIREFDRIKRALMFTLGEDLYRQISGTTDSEIMFYLALHFGMADDVYSGVARMVGLIERIGRENGIAHPMQMTLGISDGQRMYAVRYSSERDSRTLFHSANIATLRELVPETNRARLDDFSDDAVVIVSEPFSDLPGAWQDIAESSFLTFDSSGVQRLSFTSVAP